MLTLGATVLAPIEGKSSVLEVSGGLSQGAPATTNPVDLGLEHFSSSYLDGLSYCPIISLSITSCN